MSENCNHDCGSCSADCAEREIPKESLNQFSRVHKVFGVVSGKGGVGKSMVTSLMALTMNKRGHKTAILDADITGPSIAQAFGTNGQTYGTVAGMAPVVTKKGIDVMSMNVILQDPSDPVIWRGPVIGGVVKQFWTDVIWQDEEYMFIDMPPGTGDVSLTVFQSLPIDGIIIVTSPQQLVSMIVEKAVRMASMMDVPIVGIVENMSYFECPDCGKQHKIFGESHIEEIAAKYGIENIAKMPMNPHIAAGADNGTIEDFETNHLDVIADAIEKMEVEWKFGQQIIAIAHKDGEVFQHFGKCEEFKFYEILGGRLHRTATFPTEGLSHGDLAKALRDRGVTTVICGGIGEGSRAALDAQKIFVCGGVTGNADEAANAYARVQLMFDPTAGCTDGHGCGGGCCGGDAGDCGDDGCGCGGGCCCH